MTFDTSGLRFGQEDADRKVWFTPDGDGISVNFFNKPPDLPAGMRSSAQVRDFHLSMLKGGSAKLVESEVMRLAGCPALRLIIKVPQEPSGLTYLGSFTIPFRDFSFVAKCQCMERGTTGTREVILFERLHRPRGFFQRLFRRKSTGEWNPDAPEHDVDFPWHPLSRLRKVLGRIQSTAVLEPEVRSKPIFAMPAME
jgi:hypothetical protein